MSQQKQDPWDRITSDLDQFCEFQKKIGLTLLNSSPEYVESQISACEKAGQPNAAQRIRQVEETLKNLVPTTPQYQFIRTECFKMFGVDWPVPQEHTRALGASTNLASK